jgi:hypothetical protein
MASSYQLMVIICLIKVSCLLSEKVPHYDNECRVWQNVTNQLDKEPNVQMICTPNPTCTGIDCRGLYTYEGMYTGFKKFEVDFCFGMAILPCSHPVSANAHVDIPGKDKHFQATVNKSETVKIPGAHYDIGGQNLGSADGFVVIDMTNTTIKGKPYLKMGMKMKVRVQGPIDSIVLWPEALQRTLMPDSLIPIPPCKLDVATAISDPGCHKIAVTTRKPGKPTKTPPTTTTMSPSSVCATNKAYECRTNEMCKPFKVGSPKGKCVCMVGYQETGILPICTPIFGTTALPIYIDGNGPENGGTTGNHMYIIIGSVLAVVVIVSIIFAVVIIQYKRHQSRYGQHSQLMNNEEEDDDDDPLDLAT